MLTPLLAVIALAFAQIAHAQDDHFGSNFYGRWAGSAQLGSAPFFVQMDAQPKRDGSPLLVTVPGLAVFGVEPSELTRDGDAVVFVVRARGAALKVRAQPAQGDGDTLEANLAFIEGPATATNMPPVDFTLSRQPVLKDLDTVEQFNGALKIPNGGTLEMSLRLAEVDGALYGTIDIPVQGVRNLVLACSRDKDTLTLTLPVPSPAKMTLSRAGDQLEGMFFQGGLELPITFSMGEVQVVVDTRTKRPQEPEPPFPYDVANMRVPTRDGHQLAGTLFMPRPVPEGGLPFVVLVTGSGPQDRDEALMDHKPFLVLADRLARQGIASFRYDDRGVGESGGAFDTAITGDFAHDAAAALSHLGKDPRLDVARSGIIGHSEGGIVAAIVGAGDARDYQDMPRPRFIVMLAGPGVPGHEILRVQMRLLMESEGIDAEAVRNICVAQGALLDAAITGAEEDVLLSRSRSLQDLQLALNSQSLAMSESDRDAMAQQSVMQLKSPWMSAFLTYDPRDALGKLDMPVLAVNGTLDTQVSPTQNLPEISKAVKAAGGEVTIMEVQGLNHLLQPAKTGAVSEYSTIDVTMDEQAMADICAWILAVEAATR